LSAYWNIARKASRPWTQSTDADALVAEVADRPGHALDQARECGHHGLDAARTPLFGCLDPVFVERHEHDDEAREREDGVQHAAEILSEHTPVFGACAQAAGEPVEIEADQEHPAADADEQRDVEVRSEHPPPVFHEITRLGWKTPQRRWPLAPR